MKSGLLLDGLGAAGRLADGPVFLAIGMFDGVHLGHQAVVSAAVNAARREGGVAAVLTFWPHPSRIFRPDDPVRQIQQPGQRARHLLALGVDAVITEPFTREFAQLEAEEFLPHLRRALPRLTTVYVGENWAFGRGRRGTVALLVQQARAAGVRVFSAPRVNFDGEPVSSTRIRGHLEAGEPDRANELLGYTYEAEGRVTAGRRLGRTLGFPTLNVPWSPDLRPRFGVYVVRIRGGGNEMRLPAVANYGVRPTVETGAEPQLEVHVIGACPFGEGDAVVVEWLAFLRAEQRFPSVEALGRQIAADREAAIAWFRQAGAQVPGDSER